MEQIDPKKLKTAIITKIHEQTNCRFGIYGSMFLNAYSRVSKSSITLEMVMNTDLKIRYDDEMTQNKRIEKRFDNLNFAANFLQGRTYECANITFAKYYFLHLHGTKGGTKGSIKRDLIDVYKDIMETVSNNRSLYSEVIDELDSLDKAVLLVSFGLDFITPEDKKELLKLYDLDVINHGNHGNHYENYTPVVVDPKLVEEFNNKFAFYIIESLNNNNKWESVILNLLNYFPGVYTTSYENIKQIIKYVIKKLKDAMMKKRDYLVQLTQRLPNGYMLSPNEINEHRDAENKLHDRKPLTSQEKMQLIIEAFQGDPIYAALLQKYNKQRFYFPDPMNTRKVMTPVIKPENGWWLPKFSSTGGKKRKTNKRKKKKSQTKKNKRRVKKKSKSRKNRL